MSLKGLRLEEDPAKKLQLRTFREKVSRGKLVKFYANPDELKAQVMQALMHSFQIRPQEGWMRARNASRTEDLSKIISLQERVRELEAKLAEPRVAQEDPLAPFDKGDEVFEWLFPLESGSMEFLFKATWNQLLLLLFADGGKRSTFAGFMKRVDAALRDRLASSQTGRTWLKSYPPHFVRIALEPISSKITSAVLGRLASLGLIDEVADEQYCPTRKGQLHLSSLTGGDHPPAKGGKDSRAPAAKDKRRGTRPSKR